LTEPTQEQTEVWYDTAASAQILGYEGVEGWDDCVAVKLLDPDDMEVILEFRYTSPEILRQHAELLVQALGWLEDTIQYGAAKAIELQGLDKEPEVPDMGELTIQDILDAE
jgi:hypothetical protein